MTVFDHPVYELTKYQPGYIITLEHPDGSRIVEREVDSVYSIVVGKRRDYVNSFLDTGWLIVDSIQPTVKLEPSLDWEGYDWEGDDRSHREGL